MEKIDFVVTWVDGNDPQWLHEREQYMPLTANSGNSVNRFRDWELMRYWFRGIEKYAPWVNHVYFITCGHYPCWLNLDHPKLTLVKHTDYIPAKHLPTYNSNVIELYIHKIPGLSEKFVLFNDDIFLTNHMVQQDFFRNGLPCETALFGELSSLSPSDVFSHTILNNMGIINHYFSKKEVQRKYWKKFLSPSYGTGVFRNLLLYPGKYFSRFHDSHLTVSYLKSTFEEVWDKEPELLDNVGCNKFRSRDDLTHWLIKSWQICTGKFYPVGGSRGKIYEIGFHNNITSAIKYQKQKIICLNDNNPDLDFEKHKKELNEAFAYLLPEKSTFEL